MKEASTPATSAAPTTRRRVLIIEDDADIAEAITYQLEKAGLQVKVARTGEEGLDAARRGADLILLDLKDRKSTRLNSSHIQKSRMPSSA